VVLGIFAVNNSQSWGRRMAWHPAPAFLLRLALSGAEAGSPTSAAGAA
jgi:hypothetical protein